MTPTEFPPSPARLAIAGATGAVGQEMIRVLAQRDFLAADITLLASERSAGRMLETPLGDREVRVLTPESLQGHDIALFAASGAIAREYAPALAESGCWVIDNSSAFRMDPSVPLVIPEVNASEVRPGGSRIVANPNCSTIIMLVPLTPLHRAFGIERIVVSTYQAVSGAGAAGMEDLESQTRRALDASTQNDRPTPGFFSEPSAFNVFSHDSAVNPVTGRNVEEQKMIEETRKIWADETIQIEPTCVRVPVLRAHTESINITLREPAPEGAVRALLGDAPGIRIVDDRADNQFPTPLKASHGDDVLVGRLRPDTTQESRAHESSESHKGYSLLVSGDQLRKGAALNAVQIAELLVRG